MNATLARLIVYPIKSLDGWERDSSRFLPSGALEWDRRFALFDEAGKVFNAKRSAAIQAIRTRYEFAPNGMLKVFVSTADQTRETSFILPVDSEPFAQAISKLLGISLQLRDNTTTGFPDDLEANGPTIVSLATLQTVGDWFGFDVDEAVRRFRANLMIEDDRPFGDDQLYGPQGQPRAFRVGNVILEGVNPCQRCAVPARDSQTGISTTGFQKEFAVLREQSLPAEAARDQFNHFYRLAVNTRRPETTSSPLISVGDRIELV
ncbi:MOSC domain-containing protein [Lacunimicrobium album]